MAGNARSSPSGGSSRLCAEYGSSETGQVEEKCEPIRRFRQLFVGFGVVVRPSTTECRAVNGKALILALRKTGDSKTQPYFVSVAQDDLPTFYAGDALSIEVIADENQIKEIPLINFAIDMQKAGPLNSRSFRWRSD